MSKTPSGLWAMMALGMPLSRISAVSARVSTPQMPTMLRRLEPGVEMPAGAPVRGLGDGGMQDDAAHARGGGGVDRLGVVVVDADIADMGEGEGDDLPGIGRVGQDLLIARHRRVEADLARRLAGGAEAEALQHGAVGQNQQRSRARFAPAAGRRGFLRVRSWLCLGPGREARQCRGGERVSLSAIWSASLKDAPPCRQSMRAHSLPIE